MKSVWIHGITGRMGSLLAEFVNKEESFELIGGSHEQSSSEELKEGIQKSSLIIDFSSQEGNETLYKTASQTKELTSKSFLICSTGLNSKHQDHWKSLTSHNVSILFAPNTSVGVLMLLKSALSIVGLASSSNFDIEIEETHHRWKKDSPSGTALFLAESLQTQVPKHSLVTSRHGPRQENEIGIHVTRGGGVFGEHKIRFLGDFEEISLSHRSFSREIWAKGALSLGEWLCKQKPGAYSLDDIKEESL